MEVILYFSQDSEIVVGLLSSALRLDLALKGIEQKKNLRQRIKVSGQRQSPSSLGLAESVPGPRLLGNPLLFIQGLCKAMSITALTTRGGKG